MARAEAVPEVRSTAKAGPRPEVAAVARAWLVTDWAAITILVALTMLVVWNRTSYDMWVSRIDILQAYLPYYSFLGQQLRHLQIPGWNPHQFAGSPFAADPQSGWMQLPVMVLFSLFDSETAIKALMAFNIALGALASYALARAVGMGPPASLVGGIAFGFGSLIHFNTYCCTLMGNLAPWIPVSLLGVEVMLRAQRWVYRVAGVFLAGLALCQMISAWIGQGAYYGILVTGAYVLYRAVISPAGDGWTARRRLITLLGGGAAVLLTGFALSAAGLIPRLDINHYTNLNGANYEALGAGSSKGWGTLLMLDRVLNPEFVARRVYLGTVAVMLALIAPFLVRKRFAVPFFAGLTVVCLIMTLDTTPVHQVFYLLPRFKVLHQHSDYRILAVVLIGPAMLAAAIVEALPQIRVRARTVTYALLPLAIYVVLFFALRTEHRQLPIHVWIYVGVVTFLLAGYFLARIDREWRFQRFLRPLTVAFPFVVAFLLFLDPSAKDIVEAMRGQTSSNYYAVQLASRSQLERRVSIYTDCTDLESASAFLAQQRDASAAPVRYFGYDPAGLRTSDVTGSSYQVQVNSPVARALLVGARATCLGLYDIQGYNPIQVKRYVDLLQRINGVALNYHDGVVLASGIDSPLLPLLGAGYIIVPSTIPVTDFRPDLSHVRQTRQTVFNDHTVRVLANPNALPRAWVVHDVHQMPKDEILDAIAGGQVDPKHTAIVEKAPPELGTTQPQGADNVRFTGYKADRLAMDVNAASDGMLVLTEIYIPGWNAYVDGKKTEVYATDFALRGVALTAGSHHVELRYEPASLRLGILISAIAGVIMVIVFAAALWTWRRDRRRLRAG